MHNAAICVRMWLLLEHCSGRQDGHATAHDNTGMGRPVAPRGEKKAYGRPPRGHRLL